MEIGNDIQGASSNYGRCRPKKTFKTITMKINILYDISNAPFGGGNQFLRALRKEFLRLGVYSDSDNADIFLFNSHHDLIRVNQLKQKFPNRKFVHRIDGPVRLYNNMSDNRDHIVYQANNNLADATVFQSQWSRIANIKLGLNPTDPVAVIHNAVDSEIFYSDSYYMSDPSKKTRIISATFSPNMRKGFRTYEFLDKNFKKFEYVFAGNSNIRFKNIKNIGCLTSKKLADEMRASDIYITASENDPCSNSLLEAIACGLRILALKSGGHPELINNEDNIFMTQDELLKKLEDYASLPAALQEYTVKEAAELYLKFFENVLEHE